MVNRPCVTCWSSSSMLPPRSKRKAQMRAMTPALSWPMTVACALCRFAEGPPDVPDPALPALLGPDRFGLGIGVPPPRPDRSVPSPATANRVRRIRQQASADSGRADGRLLVLELGVHLPGADLQPLQAVARRQGVVLGDREAGLVAVDDDVLDGVVGQARRLLHELVQPERGQPVLLAGVDADVHLAVLVGQLVPVGLALDAVRLAVLGRRRLPERDLLADEHLEALQDG